MINILKNAALAAHRWSYNRENSELLPLCMCVIVMNETALRRRTQTNTPLSSRPGAHRGTIWTLTVNISLPRVLSQLPVWASDCKSNWLLDP